MEEVKKHCFGLKYRPVGRYTKQEVIIWYDAVNIDLALLRANEILESVPELGELIEVGR